MPIPTILSVITLLPTLIYAQNCRAGNRKFRQFEVLHNQDGCSKMQCLNGNFVPIDKVCGKQLDNQCHYSDHQFIHKNIQYQCTEMCEKTQTFEYKIVSTVKHQSCLVEGKLYNTWDTFVLCNDCRLFQCQNGNIVSLDTKACLSHVDGKCYPLNAWIRWNNTLCQCRESGVGNNVPPTCVQIPEGPKTSCKYHDRDYDYLEIFPGQKPCEKCQCQGKRRVVCIIEGCKFYQNCQCYTVNEQWQYQKTIYKCIKNPDSTLVVVIVPNYFPCQCGHNKYDHLEIIYSKLGCQISQCQDGRIVVIRPACVDTEGICRPLNSVWTIATDLTNRYKCVLGPDGAIIVVIHVPSNYTMCHSTGKDVIFIIDNSVSTPAASFNELKGFAHRLTGHFYIGTDARKDEFMFGAVSYTKTVSKVFDLNTHLSHIALQRILDIQRNGQMEQTYLALDYILNDKMFDKGREYSEKVIVIITEGNSNNGVRTLKSALAVRSKNITIMVVGFGKSNEYPLKLIVEDERNLFYTKTFKDLESQESYIVNRICEEGPYAHSCNQKGHDVIFVIDTSGNYGEADFEIQKRFIVDITRRFTIGKVVEYSHFQFGAVSFGERVTKEFDLNTFLTAQTLEKAISDIKISKQGTNTDAAFDFILKNRLFNRGRSNANKVVILITSGESSNPQKTISAAKALLNNNIKVMAVGTGHPNIDFLREVTHNNSQAFYLESFTELSDIVKTFAERLCTAHGTSPPGPPPTTPPTLKPTTTFTPRPPTMTTPKTAKPTPRPPTMTTPKTTKTTPRPPTITTSKTTKTTPRPPTMTTPNTIKTTPRPPTMTTPKTTPRPPTMTTPKITKTTPRPSTTLPPGTCQKYGTDIVIIIDNSDCIGDALFGLIVNSTIRLIKRFSIGTKPSEFMFAAVSFNQQPNKQFDLKSNWTEIKQNLAKIPHVAQKRITSRALNFVVNANMFRKGRTNACKAVILLQYAPALDLGKTIAASQRLQMQSIKVYAIGMANMTKPELDLTTNDPTASFYSKKYVLTEPMVNKIYTRIAEN